MCGIVGCIDQTLRGEEWEFRLRRMRDSVSHRGPDDKGIWYDPAHSVGLGHRRLSILDLSQSGAQPMHSGDGRFVIVYNGEVYNFQELRTRLRKAGYVFCSSSDTEVILAAVSVWGVRKAVEQFNGMFSFALWDRRETSLYLVRDRIGIKPLYYGFVGSAFVFASELKSIRAIEEFDNGIDRNALALYFRYNCVPGPAAIYKGIYKLQAGCFLRISGQEVTSCRLPEPVSYWDLAEVAREGQADRFKGTDEDAKEVLKGLLRDAVARRMIADVPLGAFLSGGIDSSAVVALMQTQSSRPVRTFSIGFREEDYNEATQAKAVAEHLGTDHTELYIEPEEARNVIPRLPQMYDEPFADSSQIPTYLVSQLARRHVTVCLSGDGGDELFGGYRRYVTGRSLWKKICHIPKWARDPLGKVVETIPGAIWNESFGWLMPYFRRYGRADSPQVAMRKVSEVLSYNQPELYQQLRAHWKERDNLVLGTATEDRSNGVPGWIRDFTQYMMFVDTKNYLPDDILVKVDRASMWNSLEVRVPLLDHRVVAFAWRLPLRLKMRKKKKKWILRQVLSEYVPEELFDRPKMGFGVPVGEWLRGPLRNWGEALLDESRIREEGYLDPEPVRDRWQQHLQRRADWTRYLWDVLMFEAWLDGRVGR